MEEILMTLDRRFCQQVQERGAVAWAEHFAEDGIMLTKKGENICGREAIYQAMKPFFENKNNSLTWEPETQGLSEDGSLGYTFGKYIRKTLSDSGVPIEETGRYMTVWRKNADAYVVEVDMGN